MNPIAYAVDKIVETFAPRIAARRAWARVQCEGVRKLRALDASKQDRTSARKRPSKMGPNETGRRDLEATRAQARELYRWNAYARGVVNSITANMIGRGMQPQPEVSLSNGEPAEKFNDAAFEVWAQWSRGADPTGRKTFNSLQKQACREKLITGEFFYLFSAAKDGREVPLSIELIPSERCPLLDKKLKDGSEIKSGVEFSAAGLIEAYWFLPEHPHDGMALAKKEPIRFPRDRVVHVHDELEPGQIRGLTRFLPVAGTYEGIMQWLDWVLTKERIASAFALMHKHNTPGWGLVENPDEESEDEDGNTIDQIEGGMFFHGKPGEELAGVSSGVQAANVSELAKVLLRTGGRGMDVSYETQARDLENVSYLSARQGENQDRRHWVPDQDDLILGAFEPVWNEFMRYALASGVLKIPNGADAARYLKHRWVAEGWDWIDPLKDIQADVMGISAGILSPIEVIQRRGRDPWKTVQEIARFQKWLKDEGVVLEIYTPTEKPASDEDQPKKTKPKSSAAA